MVLGYKPLHGNSADPKVFIWDSGLNKLQVNSFELIKVLNIL